MFRLRSSLTAIVVAVLPMLVLAFTLGHRIVTGGAPRIAPGDSFHAHPSSPKWSPFLDRFYCIGRTSRHMATRRRKNRRDDRLVKPDGEDENFAKEGG